MGSSVWQQSEPLLTEELPTVWRSQLLPFGWIVQVIGLVGTDYVCWFEYYAFEFDFEKEGPWNLKAWNAVPGCGWVQMTAHYSDSN